MSTFSRIDASAHIKRRAGDEVGNFPKHIYVSAWY